jgi:putative aldouronate transport system substrate-binding protein
VSQNAADAGKKAKIAELLEWMSSDEGYFLLGWGVEGVNYVKDAEGVPTVTGLSDPSKGFTQPEIIPILQLKNLAYYNGGIEIKARYPAYTTEKSGKIMNPGAVLFDMQKRAWTPSIGSDTLPQPSADLKRFYEQGILEFLTGKRTLTKENWTAWVAEFDKLGGAQWDADGIAYAKANGLLY